VISQDILGINISTLIMTKACVQIINNVGKYKTM